MAQQPQEKLPPTFRRAVAGKHTQRQIKLLYLSQNLIWIWIGAASLLSGLQFFIDPATAAHTAIGRELSNHLDYTWNILFIIAGAILIAGVVTRRSRLEMLGHWFLNAGILPDALAIAVLIGGGPSFWLTVGIGLASLSRLYYLVKTTERR